VDRAGVRHACSGGGSFADNARGKDPRSDALTGRMLSRLDFNCDLGEGCGSDAAIVPLISSASIACGGHAGDAASMAEAVALCHRHGVAIGAHPSFVDRANFGRVEIQQSPADIRTSVAGQVRMLAGVCERLGARMRHVKPHGALYNVAARDRKVADAIVAAIADVDPALIVYALSGSRLADAAAAAGLAIAHEVFAERAYDADGRLAPRGTPGAVIDDIDAALAQVHRLVREGVVVARDGSRVPLVADTLCLHGDRADAAAFAKALRFALEQDGVAIRAPGPAA
jgi:5-oxoprolinase (ATP-hydrolysing) subunit A